jgi:hypothetical protein
MASPELFERMKEIGHTYYAAPEWGTDSLPKFRGEPVTGYQEIKGKIYIFTPNNTYVARKPSLYDRLTNYFRAMWKDYEERMYGK